MFLSPAIFNPALVVAAQSDRLDGFSKAPFASLNLGLSVGDDETVVLRNRDVFCQSLGFAKEQLAWGRQVHGDRSLHATQPGRYEGYDAFITDTPGLVIAASAADCTPILIHDPAHKACAAIHAGWKGTVAEIVFKTLQHMRQAFGTEGKDCLAFIGACISADAFEVNADVADQFPETLKRFDPLRQKYLVDLKAANKQQLLRFGIPETQIEVSPCCTVLNNERFFSHRKEKGTTGRMMAVIGLKP